MVQIAGKRSETNENVLHQAFFIEYVGEQGLMNTKYLSCAASDCTGTGKCKATFVNLPSYFSSLNLISHRKFKIYDAR